MHSNLLLSVLTSIEIPSLAAAVFLFAWKRQLSRWPFLFSALVLELGIDLTCMSLMGPHHYRHYFFTFWWGQVGQAFLRLGIIADIFKSFPGMDFLPRRIYLFISVVALVIGFLAGIYCYHISPNAGAYIQNYALLLNRCVNISFGAFAMVLLLVFKALNFGWEPSGARIAIGFFIHICAGVVVAEMLSRIPAHTPRSIAVGIAANYLDSIFSIGIFSYWSVILIRNLHLPEAIIACDDDAHVQTLKTLLTVSFSRER